MFLSLFEMFLHQRRSSWKFPNSSPPMQTEDSKKTPPVWWSGTHGTSKLEMFLLEQSIRIQMEICKRSSMEKQRHEKENRGKIAPNAPLKINKHLKKMIKITMNHKDPDQSTDFLVVFEANDLGLYRGVERSKVGCRCRCSCYLFQCCFSPKPRYNCTMKSLDNLLKLLEYIQIYITACSVSNIRVPNRTWNFFKCILAHRGSIVASWQVFIPGFGEDFSKREP